LVFKTSLPTSIVVVNVKLTLLHCQRRIKAVPVV